MVVDVSFHREGRSLWARLVASVYSKDGVLGDSLTLVSGGVWPAIIQAGRDIDEAGVVFARSFKRVVGRGNSTRFWHDTWVGDSTLCIKFSRLFALDLNNQC